MAITMKNNRILNFKSVVLQNEEVIESVFSTPAVYEKKGSIARISYKDFSFGNADTELRVFGNKSLKIMRKGGINSVLTLENGKSIQCDYQTPYGSFEINMKTQSIINELDVNGSLFFNYAICVDDSHLSLVGVYIKLDEKEV